jgi:hypothetical protein
MNSLCGNIVRITLGIGILGIGQVAAEPLVDGSGSQTANATILEIIDDLNDWIARTEVYKPATTSPERIVFVNAGETIMADGRKVTVKNRTRGLYDGETATIYLARPWSGDNPYDRSVLLHELVHHAQSNARHWYCPQAMEWDAYRLQEEFLAQGNIESGFYWPAILLESSCSKRDIHPD